MQRIPEPELMEGAEQAQAYAEADFSEANTLFVESYIHHFGDEVSGTMLDLGCGPADIVCRLAEQYPQLRIDAVDGSAAMLAWARRRIDTAGMQQRVNLIHAHLPVQPLPHRHYDSIISNSLLHHMNDATDFWQLVRHHSCPGTRVMVMDLCRPADRQAAQTLLERYAADAPTVLRHDFYHSLLAAYRVEEIKRQLTNAGLAMLEVKVVSDRHWMAVGLVER
jgi:cyclopropane fatty-acyl-phospholipid synthase-like methyltransferase